MIDQSPGSAEIYRQYDRLLRRIAQNEEGRGTGQQNQIRKSEIEMAKASRDFEALFIQQMLKEMRRTLREDSLFDTGENPFSAQRNGNSFFRDQMYENISQSMANQGGFQIGTLLFEQLVLQGKHPDNVSEQIRNAKDTAPNATNSTSSLVRKLRQQGQALQQARVLSQTQLENRFQIGTTE